MAEPIWKITTCTVADAPALAHNNMSAFWTDPTWILLWPETTTLQHLITQSAMRQPKNLLQNRERKRHQKAIDPLTGDVVGYARWILPRELVDKEGEDEGKIQWAEAQVPDVSSEERERFDALSKSARWETRQGMDGMDDENIIIMNRIIGEKPYIKLDYLTVHPDKKGKGIATALVESGMRYAEKVGVPIFVMSFKAGRGVYERIGFREVERLIQDDSKWGGKGEYGAYFMIYDVPHVLVE